MERSTSQPLVSASAALSLAAGIIHASVIGEHMDEWWGYGAFFVIVTLAQLGFAAALFHPSILRRRQPVSRPLLLAGIVGNLALIALWAITRSRGIPFFGPEAGEVEAVGQPDLLAKAVELALVAALAILLTRDTTTSRAARS